jgi:ABC-type uncharacterized transport system permease subunit
MTAVTALFAVTALLYFGASTIFISHLTGKGHTESTLGWAKRLLGGATVLHGAHIVGASFILNVCPVRGVHFPLSVLSWLACTLYFVLRKRYSIDVAGAFVGPFALTFLLASRFASTTDPVQDTAGAVARIVLPIHVAVTVLGEALFVLAFATAVLYLLEDRRLKAKRLGGMFRRLPPLETLEAAEHRFLLAGFPLFTIGLLTGTLWAGKVESGTASDVLRAAFGYVTWAVFALVLALRATGGWRGKRAAYGTIAGFGFSVAVLAVYLLRSAAATGALACR